MNYHTNLAPSISKKVHFEKDTVLLDNYVARRKTYLFLKRAFDIFFSVFFITFVLSWLLPVISLLVIIDSKGPVFFVQQRMGRKRPAVRMSKIPYDDCE